MIIAALFLCSSLLLGFSVTAFLPIRWYKAESVAASAATGLFLGTWVSFLSIWILGYTIGFYISIILLLISSLSAWRIAAHKNLLGKPYASFKKRADSILWTIITTAFILLFSYLLFTHMLEVKNGAYYSGGSTWGDIALHLSLMTNFAYQPEFTWNFPIFASAKLSYPFLIDFTSGLLYRFGFSIQAALIAPTLLYVIACTQLLFFFSYRCFKSAAASTLTLILFFINGGPGGLVPFWQDWQASHLPLFTFLISMQKEYAHIMDSHIVFSNIIADYILPQRSFVVGLSVFGLLLTCLEQAWRKETSARFLFIFIAIVGGLLPLAHIHTFFVVMGIMVWLTLGDMWRKKHWVSPWLPTTLLMASVAAPQVFWQLHSNYTASFGHWQIGWMRAANQPILLFWFLNMGAAIIFLVTNFLSIGRLKKERLFWYLLYGALVTLFIMTNIYIFQPNEYDNMKFMIYSYLGIVILAAPTLTTWLHKKIQWKIFSLLIIVSLTITGILSVFRETYTSWLFLPQPDIYFARSVLQNTLPGARILTASKHNHSVPTLTGRPIVMGYAGWLWTYGINYQSTEKDIETMYAGTPVTPLLLKKYDISYVVIGPMERADFHINENYFRQYAKRTVESQQFSLYDVRALTAR